MTARRIETHMPKPFKYRLHAQYRDSFPREIA
uniref:Uncharacterized protein n=1 Tax=Parascaris univalens TaxID=6257 RepID=A0A915A3R2_PARUN